MTESEYLIGQLSEVVRKPFSELIFSLPEAPAKLKKQYHFVTLVLEGSYAFLPVPGGEPQWLLPGMPVYGIDSAMSRPVMRRTPLRTITLGIFQTGFLVLVEFRWGDNSAQPELLRYRPPAMLPYACWGIFDLLDHTAQTGEFRESAEHLLRYLLENSLELLRRPARSNGGKPERLWSDIAVWLNTHLDAELANLAIARHFGISSSYLNALCRRQTGISFTLFVRQLRMARAVELLQDGVPVKELAANCGYHSVSYFSRHFKAITGFSPGRYPDLPSAQ